MSRSVTTLARFACVSFLTLALLGVLVRSLIPVGFMPDFSHQAGTALVICSGIETKTIYVGEDGKPVQEHKAEAPCNFALNTFAIKPVALISSLFVPYVAEIQYRQFMVSHPTLALANFPEARGPPVSSI